MRAFYELFFEDTSIFTKLLGIIVVVMLIAVIALLMYLGYVFFDKSGSKVYQDNGIVYYGEFIPEHNTMMVMSTGKVTMPVLVHHDDAWYLDVSITDGCARASVDKEFYDSTNINDSVMVQYTRGVFNKSNIYLKYIEKLKK